MKTSHEFADDMLDAAPDFSTFCELVSARDAEHEAALAKSRAECEALRTQLDRAVELLRRVADPGGDDVPLDGAFGKVLLERGRPLHDEVLAFLAPSQPEPAKEGT